MTRSPSSFTMLLSRHTRRRAFIAALGGAAMGDGPKLIAIRVGSAAAVTPPISSTGTLPRLVAMPDVHATNLHHLA
jgi:hypothetical protein